MKTEAEVQTMLNSIIIQAGEAQGNYTARARLNQRAIALAWVLEKEKAPVTLIFDEEILKVMNSLW